MAEIINLERIKYDREAEVLDRVALTVARALYAQGTHYGNVKHIPIEIVDDAEQYARRAGHAETDVAAFGRIFAQMVHCRLLALQPRAS